MAAARECIHQFRYSRNGRGSIECVHCPATGFPSAETGPAKHGMGYCATYRKTK